MEKEIIPYEQALTLKELGFNIGCYERYYNQELEIDRGEWNGFDIEHIVSAPTFSQAFRWFREEYGLYGYPFSQSSQTNIWFKYLIQQEWKDQITSDSFITHEEAELECLKKLIEIVETKSE